MGWANLSLAIAFLSSFYLSIGARTLRMLVDLPVLQSLPVYKAHILNALVSYWLTAVFVYLALRLARAEVWLKPKPAIHSIIGLGNTLLILYVIPRIFASTIQGGGASFVVASFSPFFVIPAQLCLVVGLIWLVARSISKHAQISVSQPFTSGEYVALIFAFGIPMTYISTLYVGKEAPFRMAREAGKIFATKCQLAGERILRKPSEEVKGLFLERDGSARFEQIKDGVYGAHGSEILGEPLVNSGLLMFVEMPNDRPRRNEDGLFKYRRHGFKDSKGQPVNELESEYGLYRKNLTSEAESALGVGGAEISIKDLRTNEVVATTTYFVSSRQRKFCGESPNGNFNTGQFVIRALDLKKRHPSAWDKPGSADK